MRSKLPILLILLGFLLSLYLLLQQSMKVDFAIADHIQQAEQERHEFVISHDFDLMKAKLIEVHRDHWTEVAKLQAQTRTLTLALAGIVLLFGFLAIREFRKRPATSK